MAVETEAARLLDVARGVARRRGRAAHGRVVVAKCTRRVAVRAANTAVQVFGGYGYVDEYPVGKYLATPE